MIVSIIIPCRDLERYIERCLRSILDQDFDRTAYEIIVIADSCTDRTVAVAEKVLSASSVSYTVTEAAFERAGLARNAGLDVATGEYVWFVDGDDYLSDSSALTRLTELLRDERATAVYMTGFTSDEPVADDFAAWRYFYSRKLIGNERFGDAQVDEDWEFTRRLAGKPEYKEVRTTEKFYHYTYPREGSLTELCRREYEKVFGAARGRIMPYARNDKGDNYV